jgi:hypothetical protein
LLAAFESIDPPPFAPAPASWSWGDVGKQALLDALRGLTTGPAAQAAAGAAGIALPDAATIAAQAAASAARTRTILIIAGVATVALVGGVLLMRRR